MEKSIGEKIKYLRKTKKLTLKEVSDETGLSISFLSQVERMKSSLTLESLKKISEVLHVNPSYFFLDDEGVHSHLDDEKNHSQSVIVRGAKDEVDLAINQFLYKDLSGNSSDLNFSPMLVILNPGDNEGKPFAHGGNEFLYILEGDLTVLIDSKEYHLSAHDSIIIDANSSHYWLNHTDKPVKFLCVSSENK